VKEIYIVAKGRWAAKKTRNYHKKAFSRTSMKIDK